MSGLLKLRLKIITVIQCAALMLATPLVMLTPLHAYVFTKNAQGTTLAWATPRVSFAANWNNRRLSYDQIFLALTNSLSRWKALSTNSIDFSYQQSGSVPSSYGLDGSNSVFFSSQAPAYQQLGASTIGVTYLYVNGTTIVESDIQLNDRNFIFTTNPQDSSQIGAGDYIFLENTTTHEFGHAYGLSHSANLQSSMMFLEYRGQAKPSCDDATGMSALYPKSSALAGAGSISGSIADVGATNILGAQVTAISMSRGTPVASVITDSTGAYRIANLEPGDYVLFIEPFHFSSIVTALCGGVASGCYYGASNSKDICAGSVPFKRGFFDSAIAGIPEVFTVSSGVTTAAGGYTVSCVAMTDVWAGAHGALVTAPTLISNNAAAALRKAAFGVFSSVNDDHYYKLDTVDGVINVRVLSYSLYSPADVSVTLTDAAGVVLASSASTDDVFNNSSSFINYDASARYTATVPQDVYLKVHYNSDLSTNSFLYPAGSVGAATADPQIDSVPYYLILVSVNDDSTITGILENNARCEMTDSFARYADNGPAANSSGDSAGRDARTNVNPGCLQVSDRQSENSSTPFYILLPIYIYWFIKRSSRRLSLLSN